MTLKQNDVLLISCSPISQMRLLLFHVKRIDWK